MKDLMCNFIRRMEELKLGPETAMDLSERLYAAQSIGNDFLAIVVDDGEGGMHYRTYGVLGIPERITIPPHPRLTDI